MLDWLRSLTTQSRALSEPQRQRLARVLQHRQKLGDRLGEMGAEARWVVADVETSGLNVLSDRLIAIGAVAVAQGAVQVADSFEVVLRQERVSSDANILVHRITHDQQQSGLEPAEALLRFWEFVGDSPLVGYHAEFDRIMLERAGRHFLGDRESSEWLDLAMLAPALVRGGELTNAQRQARSHARPLDWWLAKFQIEVRKRHHAAADALGTAQLLCALIARLEEPERSSATVGWLHEQCRNYRWLLERS